MARSPIPDLIVRFNELSPEEQKVFLDLVDPQPEPEQPAKQGRKKRTTKSAKARSLSSAIATSREAKADAPKSNGQLCIAKIPGLGVECGDPEENKVHDPNGGYAGYHPFEAPAPVAERKSRRKGAAANSGASSETSMGAAISVSGD